MHVIAQDLPEPLCAQQQRNQVVYQQLAIRPLGILLLKDKIDRPNGRKCRRTIRVNKFCNIMLHWRWLRLAPIRAGHWLTCPGTVGVFMCARARF